MIRVAILEHEKPTKEIVFALGSLYDNLDWTFRHYFKASLLARKMKDEAFQVFFFDEIFRSPRLESVFIHDNPGALFVYVCADPANMTQEDNRERVLYINRDCIPAEMQRISEKLLMQARQKEVYTLTYNGVQIDVPIEDIYYLEKVDKNVLFHTRKGVFKRRMRLADMEEYFAPYGFTRTHISYLVNSKYITGVFPSEVEINHEIMIPLSRQQKKKLNIKVHTRL